MLETLQAVIPELFRDRGEEAFRKLETEAVRQAGKETGKIIITGGGVVTRNENYAPLHQNGRIYQLDRDLDLLPIDGRPVSQKTSVQELYAKRAPMYASFRDVLIGNDAGIDDAADAIWRDYCENTGH